MASRSPSLTLPLPNRYDIRYELQESKTSAQNSNFLNKLPLEVRNSIYQLCIEDAKKSRWWNRVRLLRQQCFGLSIVPRLYDPPLLQLDGYGSIPLRATCSQIYHELAHQVCFNVDKVRIGSYNFEYKEKDALVHWRTAYNLLETHPGLRLSVTNVAVKMPALRDDMMRTSQLSLRHVKADVLRKFDDNFAAVIPGLLHCLKSFQNLQDLTVVIAVEKNSPPDFNPLLPVYDILGKETVVEMRPPGSNLRSYDPWVSEWKDSWNDCLLNREVEEMNLQAVLLTGARITSAPKKP